MADALPTSWLDVERDLSAPPSARLRVGMLASLAPNMATAVLHAARRPPEIFEAAGDAMLARLVADRDIEMAIGEPPPGPGPFAVRRLAADPYVLALPINWPLARFEGRPRAQLLERLPVIARPDSPATARITRQLHASGVTPMWGALAESDLAALTMVRAGSGAAIVPISTTKPRDDALTTVRLDGLLAPRTICRYIHCDRHLPAEVDELADALASALVEATRSRDSHAIAQGRQRRAPQWPEGTSC